MSDVVRRAKAALEGVTEGPWELIHRHDGSAMLLGGQHREGVAVDGRYLGIAHEPDAEFIAAARQLVPELVAEVERLTTELTFARDGMTVRPMTKVESNLMTQVLDLRRERAQLVETANQMRAVIEQRTPGADL